MATNWPNSVQTFTNPSSGSALNSPSHADQHATVNDTVEALQTYAGMVFIKSVLVGAGVSSVTVTNAFDSRFKNYRITMSEVYCSVGGGQQLRFNLGSTTLSNYGSFYFDKFDGTSTGFSRFNGATTISCGMQAVNYDTSFSMDVFNPYGTVRTQFTGMYHGEGWSGWYAGQNTNTTAQTSFTISTAAGVMYGGLGGVIRVYGYNNGA